MQEYLDAQQRWVDNLTDLGYVDKDDATWATYGQESFELDPDASLDRYCTEIVEPYLTR